MSKVSREGRNSTYFDLGDFTIHRIGKQDLYQLTTKEKTTENKNKEITREEAQAALKKWGILNGLSGLNLPPAERYVRQIQTAQFYSRRGDETLANAYHDKALSDAEKAGIEIDRQRAAASIKKKV
jgi:hypothetical protein